MKTKTFLLLILTFPLWGLGVFSCSKDNPAPEDTLAKLPPETQTGANTFGCVINGQVFYPRDGASSLFNPAGRGLILWGDPSVSMGIGNYGEFEVKNLQDGKPANTMIIHLQGLDQIKTGDYVWRDSNFQSSIDGLMQNYVHAKIFDSSVNGWRYYGSYENSGKITITKYGNIIAGTFSGKLRLQNGTGVIEISNGRFDINSTTLSTTKFP